MFLSQEALGVDNISVPEEEMSSRCMHPNGFRIQHYALFLMQFY